MLQPGQSLQNRYRIVKVLGRGGMGAVYEAEHITLDRVCVVKEMLPPDDPELVAMLARQFEREGKTLAGLIHPNLPRVWDYFTENGNYYLVMDLVSGQSLDKLIRAQGLPEATVLNYADQLLDVLTYVHTQGVLHRDIKPANIIVQPDGRCVLVDFGLVKVVDGKMSSFSMRAMTPHYAPPEQYTGGTDARSDLYSLAATLYQALSAQLPSSVTDQFAGQPLLPLHQLRPDVSQNTVGVIEKTLQLDRAKRCQSAGEMRAALKKPAPEVRPGVGASVLTAALSPVIPVDNPTNISDSRRPPEPGTKRVQATEKTPMPLLTQIAIGAMAFVIVVLLAVVIAPALTAPPAAAPTALPTRRPGVTFEATNTTAPKPTVTFAPTDQPVATAVPPTDVPAAPNNDLLLTLAPGVTISMVRIPAGEFKMGTSGNSASEKQHTVNLDEYLIGKYDVTNVQFAAFVKATGYKTTAEKEGSGYAYDGSSWADTKGADWQHPKGPNSDLGGKDNHPVVLVSWDDAVAFCAWAKQASGQQVQLPTEAQWEKAARGTDGRIYPWGNEAPNANLLNFNMNVKDTTAVGKYSPAGDSPYGLADMAGNVWQWTADWYSDTYYGSSPASNPQGPTTGSGRVVRGGGWYSNSSDARAAYRSWNEPSLPNDDSGFRVVVASAPVS